MAVGLRQSLVLHILGEEHAVEVDFRLIETMERVFGQSADMLIPLFTDVGQVQRRLIADVVADTLTRKMGVTLKRQDIREFIITAPAEEYFVLATQLQLALLFTLKHLPADQFKAGIEAIGAGSKKKPRETTEGSPLPATT